MVGRVFSVLLFCLFASDSLACFGQGIKDVEFGQIKSVFKDAFKIKVGYDYPVVEMNTVKDDVDKLMQSLKLGRFGSGFAAGGKWNSHGGDFKSRYKVQIGVGHRDYGGGFAVEGLKTFGGYENESRWRSFLMESIADREFFFVSNDPSKREFVFGVRPPDRPALLAFVQGNDSFCQSAKTFGSCVTDARGFSRLGQALKEIGLNNDFEGVEAIILSEVANELTIEPGDKEEFKLLLGLLDSDEYRVREDASKDIADSFSAWEAYIREYLRQTDAKPETKARLNKLLRQKVSPRRQIAAENIERGNLLEDPRWVVDAWAASENIDSVKQRKFVAHLQAIVGENVGETLEDWQSWLDSQEINPKILQTAQDCPSALLVNDSNFKYARKELSDLFRFEISNDGRLAFDRNSWIECFGNRTPIEMHNDLVEYAKRKQLPLDWLTQKRTLNGLGPQHLLFRKIGDRFEKPDTFRRFRAGLPMIQELRNYLYFKGDLTLSLDDQDDRSPLTREQILSKHNEKGIRIRFRDPDMFGMRLEITRHPQWINWFLLAPKENAVLYLHDSKDGFVLHDLRADQSISVSTKTFSEFRKQYPEYFEKSFCKTLQNIGINLSESAGGPLAIQSESVEDLLDSR